MSKFSDFLASFVSTPKTLESAKGALGESKSKLVAINAMFDAAGLDLDALISAGPDSLKAHIDSFRGAEEQLAKANEAIAEHAADISTLTESLAEASNEAQDFAAVLASIGFVPSDEADVKAAFTDHVKKQAAVELAKAGHPPVKGIVTEEGKPASAKLTDADHLAAYKAMQPGDEKAAYFRANGEAIWRAAQSK